MHSLRSSSSVSSSRSNVLTRNRMVLAPAAAAAARRRIRSGLYPPSASAAAGDSSSFCRCICLCCSSPTSSSTSWWSSSSASTPARADDDWRCRQGRRRHASHRQAEDALARLRPRPPVAASNTGRSARTAATAWRTEGLEYLPPHHATARFFSASAAASSRQRKVADADLENFSRYILKRRGGRSSSSLGTMTREERHHCLYAMCRWLQLDDDDDDDDDTVVNDAVVDGEGESGNFRSIAGRRRRRQQRDLSGYAVDTADRLLHRLLYERAATTASKKAGRRRNGSEDPGSDGGELLEEWTLAVLRGWLEVCQQSPTPSAVAADRAHRLLDRVLRLDGCGRIRQQRGFDHEDDSSIGPCYGEDCAGVIEAWLRLETPHGAARAAEMLASERYLPSLLHKRRLDDNDDGGSGQDPGGSSVVQLFHTALRQSLQLVYHHDDEDVATRLGERMKQLVEDDPDGWEGLQLNPDEETTMLGNLLLHSDLSSDGAEPSSQKKLSAFEQSALQKQLLLAVDHAKGGDRENVEELVQRWNSSGTTAEASADFAPELYKSLARYYVRIGDARVATTWLMKLESGGKAQEDIPSQPDTTASDESSVDWRMQLYEGLIDLHGSSGERDAPWRADELLRRLEAVATSANSGYDKNHVVTIPESLYSKVADIWIRSGDPNPGRKLLELCHRVPAGSGGAFLSTTLRSLLVEDNLKSSFPDDEMVAEVLESLSKNWTTAGSTGFVDDVAAVIHKKKLSSSALTLARLLLDNNVTPSSAVCEHLVGAFSYSSDPDHILMLLDMLEGCQVKLTFGCYKSAIDSLVGIRHKPSSLAMKQVLTNLLHDVNEQGLEVDMKGLGILFRRGLHALASVERDGDALAILELAEKKLLPLQAVISPDFFPIPLDCYRDVATVSLVRGETAVVERMFELALDHYRSGHDDMNPDSRFYDLYMTSLKKRGTDTLAKRINLLEQLLDVYHSSQNDSFKPLESMFVGIFEHLKINPTVARAEQALSLVDEFFRIGVKVDTAYGMNNVMHLVLDSGVPNAFQVVMNIKEKLDELGVQSDSYTLHNVLKACTTLETAGHEDLESALSIAHKTLVDIRNNGWANEATYILLLQVVQNAGGGAKEKDDNILASLFDSCCEDGLLSDKAKEKFRCLLSPLLWDKLYEGQLLDGRNQPKAWSLNIKAE